MEKEKTPPYFDIVTHWMLKNAFKWRFCILLACGFATVLCVKNLVESGSSLLQALEATAYCGAIISMIYVVITFEYNQHSELSKSLKKTYKLTYKKCSIYSLPEFSKNRHEMQTFFDSHKQALDNGNLNDVYTEFNKIGNLQAKLATQDVLNYLEDISIGVRRGILDENLTKELFLTLFITYYNKLHKFIEHHRKEKNSLQIWAEFTTLAEKWKQA